MIILNLDTKKTMSALLLSDAFDSFHFAEGEIKTFNTFRIDGYLNKDFYETSSESSPIVSDTHSFWKDIKDFCFQIIKGKRTPLYFHLIFSLSGSQIMEYLPDTGLTFSAEDIQGVYLNFKYDGEKLNCTTGTSFKTFLPDKTLDKLWDSYVQTYMEKLNLIVSVIL